MTQSSDDLSSNPLRHDPGLPCSPTVILGTLDEAGPAQVRGYLGTSDGNGAVGGTAFPEPHDCGAIPVAFGTDWAAPLGTAMNSVCSTYPPLDVDPSPEVVDPKSDEGQQLQLEPPPEEPVPRNLSGPAKIPLAFSQTTVDANSEMLLKDN